MAMAIAVESAADGRSILWGAPTFDQVRVCWDETRHGVGNCARFTQQRMTAEFPSGGRIIYRSLDNPDNARGHTADGVIIDEVGDVKPAAWYEVIRPMLIDTDGWSWGIGTPRGKNWFWQEFMKAGDEDDTISWQVPTLGVAIEDEVLVRRPHPLENPYIPYKEIERIWKTTPQLTFEQEILAEFTDDGGGVFRKVAHAATAEAQAEAIEGHEYLFGVDWGKHLDFTVVAVIDSLTKELVYLDRFNQIDYTIQVGRLKALAERFNPYQIIAESNSMGEPLIEQLYQLGLPVQPFLTTNATKKEAIDALALAFERETIRILKNPTLIGELQAYQQERLPSGLYRYSSPEGMHDDTVIALALAWQGIANGVWWLS